MLCTLTDLVGQGGLGSQYLMGSPGILMQISKDCFCDLLCWHSWLNGPGHLFPPLPPPQRKCVNEGLKASGVKGGASLLHFWLDTDSHR